MTSGGGDGRERTRVDDSTIARWVLRYAPILQDRIQREMR